MRACAKCTCHFLRLQIAHYDNRTVLHRIEGDASVQAAQNRTPLWLADIDYVKENIHVLVNLWLPMSDTDERISSMLHNNSVRSLVTYHLQCTTCPNQDVVSLWPRVQLLLPHRSKLISKVLRYCSGNKDVRTIAVFHNCYIEFVLSLTWLDCTWEHCEFSPNWIA